MIVVPDTNTFHGDPTMRRRNFRILLGGHRRGAFRLAVPEVVVREVAKMAGRQYSEALDKLATASTALRNLGYPLHPELVLPERPKSERFEADLRKRLQEAGKTFRSCRR